MAWYEEWFDQDEYELVYPHRDAKEADEVVELIVSTVNPDPGARILDVGCGRGRHARRFAARGFEVTGIDLSERSIESARQRAEERDIQLTFKQQDMRTPYCDGCMNGVVNLFSSFGYFEKEAAHLEALQSMTKALEPGGWFVQDFFNAPHVRRSFVPEDTRSKGDLTIKQVRWVEDGRIKKRITIERGSRTKTFSESVKLFTLADFKAMYDEVGLTIHETFGGYDARPHDDESPRLILFATKSSGK